MGIFMGKNVSFREGKLLNCETCHVVCQRRPFWGCKKGPWLKAADGGL